MDIMKAVSLSEICLPAKTVSDSVFCEICLSFMNMFAIKAVLLSCYLELYFVMFDEEV